MPSVVFCPADKQDYVGILSCPPFRQWWLAFGRDGMAQVGRHSATAEKARVHNLLGNKADLARHLILSRLAVPA